MKKMKFGFAALVFFAMTLFIPVTVHGQEQEHSTQTMVYYRAWRDKTMHGVNTSLPDENWLTMDDIPYGIDIVNIFSYVPKGEEEKAAPFLRN